MSAMTQLSLPVLCCLKIYFIDVFVAQLNIFYLPFHNKCQILSGDEVEQIVTVFFSFLKFNI